MRPRSPSLITLAFLTLVSCGTTAPVTTRLPPPADPETGRVIVAFGDSLTAGQGLPEEDAYPSQLARKLSAAGIPARVVNAGVSGDTSAQALDRLDWTLKEKPEVAIVVLGANDGLRGLDLEQLEANLTTVVRRFTESGALVLLGGMQIPPNYGAAYSRNFAAIYPRVATATGATLIPFFLEGVAAEKTLNQSDGIHPTAEGYTRVVDAVVWPVLEPLLRPRS